MAPPGIGSDGIFRQELRAFFFAPFLDVARRELMPGVLDRVLRELGVQEAQLRDPSTWVSLDFCIQACKSLDEAFDDPSLFYRCGRLAFGQEYMGMLRPVIRAFGSPAFAFRSMAQQLPRFNKIARMDLDSMHVEGRKGHLVQSYHPVPGGPRESERYICAARIGQIAAIPTLFDMPPARVEHPECMVDGHEACRYEVWWQEPGGRRDTAVGLTLGAMASASVGLALLGLSGPALATLTAVGGLAGWSIARARRLSQAVAERAEDVSHHNDALLQTAQENERRYRELLEEKAAVDRKVEARTAELAEASLELQAALDAAKQSARARDRFFANVSHDLKTPMQLLLGPIEDLVAGREPPGGTKTALRVMRRSAHRQLSLIDQLLQLARTDSGASGFEPKNLDVRKVIEESVSAYQGVAEARDITLSVEVHVGAPLALDRFWFESAIDNLVSNALRFVEAGGRIEVHASVVEGRLHLVVADDGPGIPEDDRASVFDRFAQAKQADRARGGGVGLGLAIVREAAILHGGDATVEPGAAGRGARFVLTLPVRHRPGPVDAAPPRTKAVEDDAHHEALGALPSLVGAPKILVVEDHPEVRQFVAHVLARTYDVRTAEDGAEGLASARRWRPDIIVSDVSMPTMDGHELCRNVRADPTLSSTPLLLLTAHGGTEALVEGLRAGADDYLTKPFSNEELAARIETHLRQRRLLIELAHSSRLAALGTLATALAHQIRNPLSALVNGASLLGDRDALDDAARQQVSAAVHDSGERLERIVSDLLAFARQDHPAVLQPVLPLVERTTSLMQLRGKERTIMVRVEPAARDLRATVSESHLGHILMVLVDNALQAVDEAGCVEVRLDSGADGWSLEVLDDGPGIPNEDLERVFEPFFTTKAAGHGTGLGLALARQLAKEMDGRMTAHRRASGGTRMRVEFPQAPRDGSLAAPDKQPLAGFLISRKSSN